MSKPLQIFAAMLLLAGGFTLQLTGAAYAADKDSASDSESHHHSDDSDAHHGELNGHLSIKGW